LAQVAANFENGGQFPKNGGQYRGEKRGEKWW
jgi:hypothetical protein